MKCFLLTLLLASPVIAFSQANFQKGYVVTNSKDTLKGYINFKERSTNPTSVIFSASKDGNTQVFPIKDCVAYGIYEAESFRRYVVNISLSETDITKLSVGKNESSRRDMVFLKVLQTGGNMDLFVYTDALKQRFYMKDKDHEEPVELIRGSYFKAHGESTIVEDKSYGRQLYALMTRLGIGTDVDGQRILQMRYDQSSMEKAAAFINGQKIVKSKHKNSRFFVGAGLMLTDVKYNGAHPLASADAESKVSVLPMLTVGLDLFVHNSAVRRLIFRTELSLSMSKNEIRAFDNADRTSFVMHHFDQINMALSPQFLYNFYNADRLKCFAGAGVGLNYAITRNNVSRKQTSTIPATEIEAFEPEKFNYSLQCMAGVVLNKKIEIAVGYSPYVSITNYQTSSIIKRQTRLGLNYLF